MLEALEGGYVIALTADVPKIPRVDGRGIVTLASVSNRPIYAIAVATSRRIELGNWDSSTINLPFSRGAAVFAGPIWVPPIVDEAALEASRKQVETALNRLNERAYKLVDRRGRGG
jgi:hypothetical protein